jgi:cytoskeleton protein RodZ
MAKDADNAQQQTDEPRGPMAGERLAAARHELQISVLEIAKELHLDEPKVKALERNEFDALGAPVFAKGHLKKYADLVDVDVDDILADYYELNRLADMPPVVSTRPRPRQELSPGPWIGVIVVVVLAATAYWWFTRPPAPSQDAVPVAGSTEAITPEVVSQEPAAEPPDADAEKTATGPEAQSETQPVAEESVVEETRSPEIAPGQMRMLLTYTGDCWTEVTDGTGRRLFFALGTDGRTVELSGAEPFSVLFGDPSNVVVLVNGNEYPIPAAARSNSPLRLSVSGP